MKTNEKSNLVRFVVDDEQRKILRQFDVVRIVEFGETEAQAFTRLANREVNDYPELLGRRFGRFDQLEEEAAAAGYSVNRSTLWKQRTEGLLEGIAYTDGVALIFDLDKMMQRLRGEKVTV